MPSPEEACGSVAEYCCLQDCSPTQEMTQTLLGDTGRQHEVTRSLSRPQCHMVATEA